MRCTRASASSALHFPTSRLIARRRPISIHNRRPVCSAHVLAPSRHLSNHGLPDASTILMAALHRPQQAAKKRPCVLHGRLAPQVRLELTTLRLTAECSAIELLRIIAAGACAPARLGSPSLRFAPFAPLCSASLALFPSAVPGRPSGLPVSRYVRGPFGHLSRVHCQSGKNFRFSRSRFWIPATSYSPKPFPAQYHQRLEA